MESTAALRYEDLASHVGDFAGYGPTAPFDSTGSLNTSRVDRAIRGGCRKVYSPLPPYDWSWLHLYTTLLLPAGKSSLYLPDDCAGIEGDLIVTLSGATASGSLFPRIELTNPEFVKANLATTPAAVGWPRIAAIEQLKGGTVVSGQRQQLIIYPVADQAYAVSFAYYVVPDAPAPAPPAGTSLGTNPNYPGIATGNPYVYGGAVHAELFKEAVLAEYESLYNDMTGLHSQQFQQRLLASMAVDRRSKPQYLGKNRDSSDDARGRGGSSGWNTGPAQYVLYNGRATN